MPLDRRLEAAGNLNGLGTPREIGDQKAELVAAEPCVQIARRAGPFDGKKVLGPDLVGQNTGDALDDTVAERVAERVVVPLETADIDDPDAAPANALFDGEKRPRPAP